MDLRRLEIFCKLMETRSFSRTGQELDLTQPTISGHIKILEQQIDLTLFDRHRRKVKPTSAAVVLYDYARRILELHQEAGYALERFRGRIGGSMKVGGSTIPGVYILPLLIGRFHHVYPETRLTLILNDTERIVESIYKGDLELGLVGAQQERAGLSFEPLVEDQMVLISPRNHPWAMGDQPITVTDLTTIDFIIREEGSGTRTSMQSALASHGVGIDHLNIVAEIGGTEAVCQAVKAGLGCSIVSRIAVEDFTKSGSVKIIPVKGLDLGRQFFLVFPDQRPRSPLCTAFLDFLRTEALQTHMKIS